jgi:hypothetical protein
VGHNMLPSYLRLAHLENQAFVVLYTNSDLLAVVPVLLKCPFLSICQPHQCLFFLIKTPFRRCLHLRDASLQVCVIYYVFARCTCHIAVISLF